MKHTYGSMFYNGIYSNEINYMFRPIAASFRLIQLCSKSVKYMPILRGDTEISSSLRVTVRLFTGMSNGQ